MKTRTAVKAAPVATPARAKTLTRADRVAAERAAAERRVEERRAAKRAASARWYAKQRAARLAPSQHAQTQTAIASKPEIATISKAQLIATLEVQIAAARANGGNPTRIETLETTLRLAKLLAG